MSKKNYPFIDIMRIISSLLVIGIHTFPFLQINPSLDFFMTRILGRIAVPFFFMTTAFFLFSEGLPTFHKLKKVLLQLFIIDIVSIFIYIPIQIYNHTLATSLIEIIKDVLIDGTFYHLWYIPASMIGIVIIYILIKYIGMKLSFMIVCCLYLIGVGGDAYYGITSQLPCLSYVYDYVFMICDYTRNGIFFAPMFLWLGAFIAQHQKNIVKKHCFVTLLLSFLLMSLEMIFLHHNKIPRHDAMTLFLPITMLFFFVLLISYTGKRYSICKDLSLYVYILHPLMIIVTRLFGKMLNIEKYVIDSSLIHFLIVTLLSFLLSYFLICIQKGVLLYGYDVKNRS